MKGIEIHNEIRRKHSQQERKSKTTLLSPPRPSSTSFSFAVVTAAASDLLFYALSFSNERREKGSNEPVRDAHQSYLRLPFPAVGVVSISLHEKRKEGEEDGEGKERTSAGVSSG